MLGATLDGSTRIENQDSGDLAVQAGVDLYIKLVGFLTLPFGISGTPQ